MCQIFYTAFVKMQSLWKFPYHYHRQYCDPLSSSKIATMNGGIAVVPIIIWKRKFTHCRWNHLSLQQPIVSSYFTKIKQWNKNLSWRNLKENNEIVNNQSIFAHTCLNENQKYAYHFFKNTHISSLFLQTWKQMEITHIISCMCNTKR